MKISYELSSTYNTDHEPLYGQVAWLTREILDSYDGHWDWLQNKFFPGLKEGKRGYSFAVDYDSAQAITTKRGIIPVHTLAGCALLKDEPDEKKLCCLFVDPNYRGQKIASKLVEDSFEILKTNKPVMTVSQQNLGMLQKLIDRYGFELTSIKESVYKPGVKEYYYNEGLAR